MHHHDNVDIAKELTLHGHLVMADPSKYFKGETVKVFTLETDTIKRRSSGNDGVSVITSLAQLNFPFDYGNYAAPANVNS